MLVTQNCNSKWFEHADQQVHACCSSMLVVGPLSRFTRMRRRCSHLAIHHERTIGVQLGRWFMAPISSFTVLRYTFSCTAPQVVRSTSLYSWSAVNNRESPIVIIYTRLIHNIRASPVICTLPRVTVMLPCVKKRRYLDRPATMDAFFSHQKTPDEMIILSEPSTHGVRY